MHAKVHSVKESRPSGRRFCDTGCLTFNPAISGRPTPQRNSRLSAITAGAVASAFTRFVGDK